MAKKEKVFKIKRKIITRAQAEKLISGGADPNQFLDHPNYHTRLKSWKKLGRPLPAENEVNAFLAKLRGVKPGADATTHEAFYADLRAKLLGFVKTGDEVVANPAADNSVAETTP